MIRNFILDMGNVVIRWAPETLAHRLAKDADGARMLTSELFGQYEWGLLDLDQMNEDDVYRAVSSRIDAKYHGLLRRALDHWHEYMEPMPGAYEFIEALKARDYGVYLLTNASLRISAYEHAYPAFQLLDGMVVSAREHIAKPDKAIYDLICARYHLVADECMFLDDIQANVDGAIRAGMHSLRFDGDFAALRAQLRTLGIEV